MPDSSIGRALTFFLLFVYHATHSLSRTFTTALLAQVSWFGLVVFTVADHVTFQLYKLIRDDFIYWLPGLGVPLSLIARLIAKVLTDFTGLVHFRHPCELGGAYFLWNASVSQLSVLVCAFLYWQYYVPSTTGHILGTMGNSSAFSNPNVTVASAIYSNHSLAYVTGTMLLNGSFPANSTRANSAAGTSSSDHKIDPLTLFASVGALIAIWATAVLGLSLTIKREYRHTFWSAQTGCAYSRSYFLDHEGNDAKRIHIFDMNARHWRSIRDRVRQWVLSMYATWDALKPAWFTDAAKARIPDEFMHAEAEVVDVIINVGSEGP
jgi:hypothetical protein